MHTSTKPTAFLPSQEARFVGPWCDMVSGKDRGQNIGSIPVNCTRCGVRQVILTLLDSSVAANQRQRCKRPGLDDSQAGLPRALRIARMVSGTIFSHASCAPRSTKPRYFRRGRYGKDLPGRAAATCRRRPESIRSSICCSICCSIPRSPSCMFVCSASRACGDCSVSGGGGWVSVGFEQRPRDAKL